MLSFTISVSKDFSVCIVTLGIITVQLQAYAVSSLRFQHQGSWDHSISLSKPESAPCFISVQDTFKDAHCLTLRCCHNLSKSYQRFKVSRLPHTADFKFDFSLTQKVRIIYLMFLR